MAAKENDAAYAVRNQLTTHLNKSRTGCFLVEALRRGTNLSAKIANNARLLKQFIGLLESHPTIKMEILYPKDGIGEEKVWVYNKNKHHSQPFPAGYYSEEEYRLSKEPKPVYDFDNDIQQTKYDKLPEPAEVVFQTKSPIAPNAFAALHDLLDRPGMSKSIPEHIVEDDEIDELEVVEAPVSKVVMHSSLTIEPLAIEPQEKEPVKMTVAHEPVNAATLMERAKEMIAAAERMEKIEKMESTFSDIREAQLDIARNSAIILRLNEELLEASENLNKASEKLRVLVQGK